MKKIRETFVNILIIIPLLGIVFGLGYWFGIQQTTKTAEIIEDTTTDIKLPGETEKKLVTKDEVKAKLIDIGEFSTYSGKYNAIKGYEYPRYILNDIRIPGTTNTITPECEGIVKVGYNLDDIQINIDNENYIIYILLPEASVNDNYVIWDSVECTEKNNLLNPIEFEQYQDLINEIETDGLLKVEEQEIYKRAEENIKTLITKFLSDLDGYKIKFL